MPKVRPAQQRSAETRCLFCHGGFIDEEDLSCKCGALYHQDCYETYGCGTIGCSGTIVPKTQLSEVTRQIHGIVTRQIHGIASDVRTTPLGIASFLWLLGASIIGLLAVFCATFHSALVLPPLVIGTVVSYLLAFEFRHKAHKALQLEVEIKE